MLKIKSQIIFLCSFLISTAALFSQSQNQDEENTAAAPLMMFRPGGARENGPERTMDNRWNQANADSTQRGNVSRGVVENATIGTLPSQQRGMPAQGELASGIRENIRTMAELDVSIQIHRELLAAQQRLATLEGRVASFQTTLQQEEYTRERGVIFGCKESALTIERMAGTAYDKALESTLAEQPMFYEQAIQRRHAAVAIWEQAIESAESLLSKLSADNRELKNWWSMELKNIKHAKNKTAAEMLWDQALKSQSILRMMEYQTPTTLSDDSLGHYTAIMRQASEAQESWNRVAMALEEGLAAMAEDDEELKMWWKNGFITTTDGENHALSDMLFYSAMANNVLAHLEYCYSRNGAPYDQLIKLENAIEHKQEALAGLERAIQFSYKSKNSVSEKRSDLEPLWSAAIRKAEDAWGCSSAELLTYNASKMGHIATAAAHQALTEPCCEMLHDAACQKINDTIMAWKNVREVFERGWAAVPIEHGNLRRWWDEGAIEAADKINHAIGNGLFFYAEKASMAADEKFFLIRAPFSAEAKRAWEEVIQFSQEALAALPMYRDDLKNCWIPKIEYAQARR